jgi:hypothetical protein
MILNQIAYCKDNLVAQLPDTVVKMETHLKGLIQQYNNRMVDDDLTREGSQIKKSISAH